MFFRAKGLPPDEGSWNHFLHAFVIGFALEAMIAEAN